MVGMKMGPLCDEISKEGNSTEESEKWRNKSLGYYEEGLKLMEKVKGKDHEETLELNSLLNELRTRPTSAQQVKITFAHAHILSSCTVSELSNSQTLTRAHADTHERPASKFM